MESDHPEYQSNVSISGDDYEDDGEIDDDIKIEQIIACREDTRQNWHTRCQSMRTSEIEHGSRWYHHAHEKKKNCNELDAQQKEERFLVKWADLSFLHCSWETKKDLIEQTENANMLITNFYRRNENGYRYQPDERGDGEFFDPSFITVERILDVKGDCSNCFLDTKNPNFERGLGRQFLIKWQRIPYTEVTYEFEIDLLLMNVDYESQVNIFFKRCNKPTLSSLKRRIMEREKETRKFYKVFGDRIPDDRVKAANIEVEKKKLENRVFPNNGLLRDYQVEGILWLRSNYVNGRSSILADEMGLGKTIQIVAFLDILSTVGIRGPFLIVAPLSTIFHWQREARSWSNLNTVVYAGKAPEREIIRELEFAFECDRPSKLKKTQLFLKNCHKNIQSRIEKIWMAEIVITTPETLTGKDKNELMSIDWEVLIIDEAHRVKNQSSRFTNMIREEKFLYRHSVLLTGTPIQNNISELWTLLNITDPSRFGDFAQFMSRYDKMKDKDNIDQLHELIQPYILRRLKEDVENSLPPKEEIIIEVELTSLQKQYYRALYEKNSSFLYGGGNAVAGPSLNYISMQLRKCCNHLFLLNGVEEKEKKSIDFQSDREEADFLVKSSGKLVLLDKLLPKLKAEKHRVLMFSQFTTMLDILEDYLSLRGYTYERIDGSITGKEREMTIDRFQLKGTSRSIDPAFVMLLSTRAGGVGINLTAADTCIIFDSDWNPQNDIQAQSRCHRIGQKKSVKVYRLLTRKTFEFFMFNITSLKMGLDKVVLQGVESKNEISMSKEEVERLLRFGAYHFFNEEENDSTEKVTDFFEEDIDSILKSRTKKVHCSEHKELSNFKSTFSTTKSDVSKDSEGCGVTSTTNIDVDDPDFWRKILGNEEMNTSVKNNGSGEKSNYSTRQKRKRINYSEQVYFDNLFGALGTDTKEETKDIEDADEALDAEETIEAEGA